MKLFAFNVIQPRQSGARTHTVHLQIVLSENVDAALKAVQKYAWPNVLIQLRNEFRPDEPIFWSSQSWPRKDVEEVSGNCVRGTFSAADPVSKYSEGQA
jgi:hypothetical protein